MNRKCCTRARKLSEENADVRILEVEKLRNEMGEDVCVCTECEQFSWGKIHNNERMVAATAGKWQEKNFFAYIFEIKCKSETNLMGIRVK